MMKIRRSCKEAMMKAKVLRHALFGISALVLLTGIANATVTIPPTGYSGFSGVQPGIATAATTGTTGTTAATNPGTPTFFIGTTGLNTDGSCSGTLNGDGTCNTCRDTQGSGTTPTACNLRAGLANSLTLSIAMSSDQTTVSQPQIWFTSAAVPTLTQLSAGVTVSQSSVGANQLVTFTVPWSQICNTMSTASNALICLIDGTTTLTFYFNTSTTGTPAGDSVPIKFISQYTNCDTVGSPAAGTSAGVPAGSCPTGGTASDGLYNFNLTDGDQKAYVTDPQQGGSYPLRSGGQIYFRTARFYYSEVPYDPSSNNGCSSITKVRNTSTFIDNPLILSINSGTPTAGTASTDNGTLTNEYLNGLSNGHAYVFKIALVDQAGNVGYFTNDSDCGDYAYNALHSGAQPTNYGNHVAHPSQVQGLLSKPLACFVATAAFGSPLNPFVKILRAFRDRYLIPSPQGVKFVKWYYAHSPEPAAWIAQHPLARQLTQVALWPAIGFAWASLNFGMPSAIALSIVAVFLLFLIVRQFFRVVVNLSGLVLWIFIFVVIGSSVFLFSMTTQAETTTARLPRAPAQQESAPQEAPYTQPLDDDELAGEVAGESPGGTANAANSNPPAAVPKQNLGQGWRQWKDPFAGKSQTPAKDNPAAVSGDPTPATPDNSAEWRSWKDPFKNAPDSTGKIAAPVAGKDDAAWRDWDDPFKGQVEDSAKKYPESLSDDKEVIDEDGSAPSKLAREKGVQRISKSGEYKYGLPIPVSTKTAGFQVSSLNPVNLQNAATGTSYSTIYGGAGTVVLLDYEWDLTKKAGIVAFKLGTGFSVSQGHGQFVTQTIQIPRPNGSIAQELYTLALFPNSASLVYRAKYYDAQIFVPFVEGGLDYYTFAEIRDDGVSPKFGGSALGHFGGGLAIAMDRLSPKSILDLDRDYGISHVYVVVEGRVTKAIETTLDFSSTIISGGFAFDF